MSPLSPEHDSVSPASPPQSPRLSATTSYGAAPKPLPPSPPASVHTSTLSSSFEACADRGSATQSASSPASASPTVSEASGGISEEDAQAQAQLQARELIVDQISHFYLGYPSAAGSKGKTDSQTTLRLSSHSLADLEPHIQHRPHLWGYWKDKARYEYSADSNVLRLYMPGLIHEDFTAQFSDSILARARACLAETQLAPEDEQLLKHLRRSGSPDLEFQPDDDAVYKKQPDGCIWIVDPAINERSTYPAFVMEVAKSENPEHLKIACYNMIVDSQALVKCVVGFALEPNRAARKKEDKTACVGIWRGTSTATAFTVDEPSDELKTFRQADGTPAHGDLRFTIGDFVPEATAAQLSDKSILDRQIIFTLSDLADILRTAEIGRAKLDDTAPRKTGPKRKAMPLPEVYDDLRDPKMRRLEKEAARKEDIEAGESFRKDDGKTAVDSEEPRGRVLATARSKRSSRRSAGLQASASSQRSRDGS